MYLGPCVHPSVFTKIAGHNFAHHYADATQGAFLLKIAQLFTFLIAIESKSQTPKDESKSLSDARSVLFFLNFHLVFKSKIWIKSLY